MYSCVKEKLNYVFLNLKPVFLFFLNSLVYNLIYFFHYISTNGIEKTAFINVYQHVLLYQKYFQDSFQFQITDFQCILNFNIQTFELIPKAKQIWLPKILLNNTST